MKKTVLGQFYTKMDYWLKKHIQEFIKTSKCKIAYDPFVGNGDLLKVATELGFKNYKGLDIEPLPEFEKNDSLINIPKINKAIIITNPPYLTNYSAKRKGIYDKVSKYFEESRYEDIYMIALERMLEAQDDVVAIIPETFINSSFKSKQRLNSITILEENCFNDTENPVCVACFDKKVKSLDSIKVYKNENYLNSLGYFENMRLKPFKNVDIKFNSIDGALALRAVDTTNPQNTIRFMKKDELDYDLKGIKESSRLITIIKTPVDRRTKFKDLISESNNMLENFRTRTHDVLLSPFKGNMKDGRRRRRLDYETARAIIEMAYQKIWGGDAYEQHSVI